MKARFKRGDISTEHPGKLFFRYNRALEVWVTPEVMERKRINARRIDKRWKKSPAGREYMRDYFREYNKLPSQVEYHSQFYKQPHVRARIRKIHHLRSENDIEYRIAIICRSSIRAAFRRQGIRKATKAEKLLGCTSEFFRGWIESQFKYGMSWENYGSGEGQWSVDHVKPISGFSLQDESECLKAFHYSNCSPMWAKENMSKSDFITHNGRRIRARDLRKQNIIPFTIAA